MNEILDYLKKNKFEFDDSSIIKDDNGSITHIYTGKWDLYYCIICPHSGNYYHYILRANHNFLLRVVFQHSKPLRKWERLLFYSTLL